ncbi:uncharacterized protein LY79DRAFT_655987 [Colletotrichum navitas]|uniref:Clr5 domain-containing protein n=1 Tax=Colletotrichum navitas TaxID=681940 RepID=A0AAD8Q9S8_9PEZI|nr:uncharacterized protein LY79DRAFT_655987 [Colletotrichum navitas]KAK1598224.1 hypothetical protein LY79DRAFT_655987 [Colletotrichum navitas]
METSQVSSSSKQDLRESLTIAVRREPGSQGTPSEADWELHKATIIDIYKRTNMGRLQREMETLHDFKATKRMYDRRFRKWEVAKNMSKSDKVKILASLDGEPKAHSAALRLSRKDWEKIESQRKPGEFLTIDAPGFVGRRKNADSLLSAQKRGGHQARNTLWKDNIFARVDHRPWDPPRADERHLVRVLRLRLGYLRDALVPTNIILSLGHGAAQEEWRTKYLPTILDPVDDETHHHPWLYFVLSKGI